MAKRPPKNPAAELEIALARFIEAFFPAASDVAVVFLPAPGMPPCVCELRPRADSLIVDGDTNYRFGHPNASLPVFTALGSFAGGKWAEVAPAPAQTGPDKGVRR